MSGIIYPPPRRLAKRRLEPRQAISGESSVVQASTTTSAQQSTTTTTTAAQQTTAAASSTTSAPPTTTQAQSSSSTEPAETTTTQPAQTSSAATSSAAAATTSAQQSSASSALSSAASAASSSAAAASPTSQSVTVSVVEITVTGSGGSIAVSSATTSIVLQPSNSAGSSASRGSSGLSSGARAGVIAGSVVGGVALLALILAACLLVRRKRRNQLNDKDQIRWPELAATAEDRAALYPETTHRTGRAGVGEDGDMEQIEGASAYSGGAGVAGVGAGALAGRYPSQSSNGRQPTLPQIAPSIYDSDNGYGQGAIYPPSQSHYASTNQSHGQNPAANGAGGFLGAGPASIDYYARQNQTPSPPRPYGDESSTGHEGVSAGAAGIGAGGAGGAHQGTDPYAHEEPVADGRSSPQPMQVGGAFGSGYDESDGGKRWRLSVVNDDARRE